MKTEFKNIIGETHTGEVATIRFFGKITEESTRQFNSEFDYLENVVRPSLIRVLINSEGGSVLYGMNTFSTIQNSKIPTECIIEGIAASMGSIIWAAGDRSLMRDYSILMIHFPRLPNADNTASDLVDAFANQLKTIYRKRFGLSEERVLQIMKGDVGHDGTFFDAEGAIKEGIIPIQNVVVTSPQFCQVVKGKLSEIQSASDIQDLMSQVCNDLELLSVDFKPFCAEKANCSQTINNIQMDEKKNNSPEYAAVAASLGLIDSFKVEDVMARISDLTKVEAQLVEKEKKLKDAETVIAGKDAAIQNLQKDLDEVTGSLNVYKLKEEQARKEKNLAMIQAAIDAGKIDATTTDHWMKMAEANAELVENTLASIPAREQISKEIASDPDNIQATIASTKTAEELMAEKVNAVVGESFEFKKMT